MFILETLFLCLTVVNSKTAIETQKHLNIILVKTLYVLL